MEKQAAHLYTRKIVMKFQEELVETLAYPATAIDDTGLEVMYWVAKFGEDHKAHFVKFNIFRKKASCSCQMFEFSGIICKQVLAVFRVTNVLILPSHYILKRWTRNAKSGVAVDGCTVEMPSNSQESYAARYDNLCHEAIKFVGEGKNQYDQEKKIQDLSMELEDASRRCEGYCAKLVDVLKDMEEQKLKMSM
ncbi:hypothetical protein CRYUN_Cryun27aG0120800 [Craigia yunnanensis]